MDLGTESYSEYWEEFECDGFEVDSGGEMDAPIAQSGFVIVGRLDPKTRMYIKLFAQGPPEGCDPELN
jgi:hypothetical protein